MAAPLGIWIAVEIAIRVIPGCKAQNFGDNLCFVGTINLAGGLILARIGGFAMFLVLTSLVALPLFVIAAFLMLHNRSAQKRRPRAAPDLQR